MWSCSYITNVTLAISDFVQGFVKSEERTWGTKTDGLKFGRLNPKRRLILNVSLNPEKMLICSSICLKLAH